MTKQTRVLAEAAAKLPAAERIVLVEEILATLPGDDTDWNAAWGEEAARRMAAYDRGEVSAIDSDEVFAELDAKYR
ncbi:MAG: addiction module protein [Rhodocyclales bacterium]|nr:addiction module protein [Rhodocyclales bacterium]